MQTVTWWPEMALGIPAMDASHQTLLEELGRLADTKDAEFGAAFARTIAAIERDFADEEEAMEGIAYPGLRAHREQHARVLSGLHQADPYVRQGDVALGRKAVALLPQWFLLHQSTMDMALATALVMAGQGPATASTTVTVTATASVAPPHGETATRTATEGGHMYKHILVPTDGSAASEAAVQSAVRFAKEIGARVTGIYVVPEFHLFTYKTEMLEDTREQFAKDSNEHAEKFLASIEGAARDMGVPFDTVKMVSDHPYEAIIQTARDLQCDLIAMASHGRRGVRGMLLGSETQKVLMHSAIPVLVYR